MHWFHNCFYLFIYFLYNNTASVHVFGFSFCFSCCSCFYNRLILAQVKHSTAQPPHTRVSERVMRERCERTEVFFFSFVKYFSNAQKGLAWYDQTRRRKPKKKKMHTYFVFDFTLRLRLWRPMNQKENGPPIGLFSSEWRERFSFSEQRQQQHN